MRIRFNKTLGIALSALLIAGAGAWLGLFLLDSRDQMRIVPPAEPIPAKLNVATSVSVARKAPRPEPARPATSISVKGRVVDSAGNGIPDARILSVRTDAAQLYNLVTSKTLAAPEAGHTGTDGTFLVKVSEANVTYDFRAVATGYISETHPLLVPAKGLDNIEFVLRSGGQISGRVVDLDRQPLTHVIVHAAGESRTTSSQPTEKGGAFSIDGLPEGPYALTTQLQPQVKLQRWTQGLYLDGNAPLRLELKAGEQKSGVEIIVPVLQSRRVAGHVYDEKGHALAGVMAWAGDTAPLALGDGPSDNAGAFTIASIPLSLQKDLPEIEAVTVHCEYPGYEPAIIEKVPIGSKSLQMRMGPLRRGDISGVVLDKQTREPISSAQVLLGYVEGDWGSETSNIGDLMESIKKGAARVDRRGRFSISEVKPGVAKLNVYAKGYGLAERQVTVKVKETSDIEVLLEPAGTLQVNVIYSGVMEGREADTFQLSCWPAGEEGSSFPLMPSLLRMFRGEPDPPATGTPAATYEMELTPDDYAVIVNSLILDPDGIGRGSYNHHAVPAHILAGQTTVVDMDIGGTGIIEGFAAIKEPAATVDIFLIPGTDTSFFEEGNKLYALASNYALLYVGRPNQDGIYHINCVPPGTYTLLASDRLPEGRRSVRESRVIQVGPSQIIQQDFL